MNLKSKSLAIASAAALFCSGCASILDHTSGEVIGVYPGVRADAHLLTHPKSDLNYPIHPAFVITFGLIDMPLSAALDTLLLPIDLTYHKSDKEKTESKDKSKRQ